MYMTSLECLVIAMEQKKRKTSKVRVLIFPVFSPFSGKSDSGHVK